MKFEEHKTIWLEPWCDRCDATGDDRMWCQDNVWEPCDECERRPVKYVLAKKDKR
jgi:hypothetical protein